MPATATVSPEIANVANSPVTVDACDTLVRDRNGDLRSAAFAFVGALTAALSARIADGDTKMKDAAPAVTCAADGVKTTKDASKSTRDYVRCARFILETVYPKWSVYAFASATEAADELADAIRAKYGTLQALRDAAAGKAPSGGSGVKDPRVLLYKQRAGLADSEHAGGIVSLVAVAALQHGYSLDSLISTMQEVADRESARIADHKAEIEAHAAKGMYAEGEPPKPMADFVAEIMAAYLPQPEK